MQGLTGLLGITERPVQGPSPSFEKAHLVLAFMNVGESGTVGRQALAARSGVTEGPMRTIIKKLRDGNYVQADASGCHLTKGGQRVFSALMSKLTPTTPVGGSKLTIGNFQVGLGVRGGGGSVQSGLEQRDSAIRIGAAGATTFVFRNGKFSIPGGSSDCEKDYPSKAWPILRERLEPKNGDAIILCGARDETTAKLGALSAALTLL